MQLFFLGVSVIFLVIVNVVAYSHRRTGVGLAALCSIAAIFIFNLCGMAIVLPLNALLVAVAGTVCWWFQARRRWFLASSLIATTAAYVFIAMPDLRAWDRLKTEYPLESLAGRLTYEEETRTASFVQNPTTKGSDRLAHLEERFQKEERGVETRVRVISLEQLHGGVVKQFIASPGFGVGRRIVVPRPRHLERKQEEPPIPQPTPAYSPADLSPESLPAASWPDLVTAHEDNIVDFLHPSRFGYIRDRDHVAGFRPHTFRYGLRAPDRWKVARVELVGVLKEKEPVVYLSSNLPRMDELSKAPTRPLDAFEKKALEGLLGGQDLMVQQGTRRLRMLGAIRAVQQCVRCHRVKRGELLGAFSYQMRSE